MSVDEMIDYLQPGKGISHTNLTKPEIHDRIIAALRVVQELRNRCQMYHADMGGNHTYHTNSQSITKFVKAWDEATKDEI